MYPDHVPLLQSCAQIFDELEPTIFVRQTVGDFYSSHFGERMIGVHLRRGDFDLFEGRDNTSNAVKAVDAFLKQDPNAGIFLSTDDGAPHQRTGREIRPEGVKDRFRRIYGERVVFTTPRSLDRRTPQAVQDALVDLMLLRRCDYFVGTKGSSFSMMAAFGRNVPVVRCSSGPVGRARAVLTIVSGIYPLLWLLARLENGRPGRFSARYHRLGWRLGSTAALLRPRAAAHQRVWHPLTRFLKIHTPRLYASLRGMIHRD